MANRDPASTTDNPASLTVRLGGWFEARATGWGVAAIPALLFLLTILAAAHIVLT